MHIMLPFVLVCLGSFFLPYLCVCKQAYDLDGQVSHDPKPHQLEQKSKPEAALKAEPAASQAPSAATVSLPVKVDYATHLFHLLSVEESRGNDFVTSANKNTLAGLHGMFDLISLEQLLLHHIVFPPRTKKKFKSITSYKFGFSITID